MRERKALVTVWPDINLRLSMFHTPKAWNNMLNRRLNNGDKDLRVAMKLYMRKILLMYVMLIAKVRARCWQASGLMDVAPRLKARNSVDDVKALLEKASSYISVCCIIVLT